MNLNHILEHIVQQIPYDLANIAHFQNPGQADKHNQYLYFYRKIDNHINGTSTYAHALNVTIEPNVTTQTITINIWPHDPIDTNKQYTPIPQHHIPLERPNSIQEAIAQITLLLPHTPTRTPTKHG